MESIHNETMSKFVARIFPSFFLSQFFLSLSLSLCLATCDKVEKKIDFGWLEFANVVVDIGQIKSTEIVSTTHIPHIRFNLFFAEKLLETNRSSDQFMDSRKEKRDRRKSS